MKLITKTMPRDFNLYVFGDDHGGTILRHKEGFERLRGEIIDDPIGYGIHMGDGIEAITVDDKRYCMETQEAKSTPVKQALRFIEDYKPIAEKMLVYLAGNHDRKLRRFGNILKDVICQGLYEGKDVSEHYGTFSCKLALKDNTGKLMFKLFLVHGFGKISSRAGKPVKQLANMLEQLQTKLEKKAGDCLMMFMGHTHKLLLLQPIAALYLTDDGKKHRQHYTEPGKGTKYIPPEHRYYGNTGSLVKLYGESEDEVSGYAEEMGCDPIELGYIKVEVRDGVPVNVYTVIL